MFGGCWSCWSWRLLAVERGRQLCFQATCLQQLDNEAAH
jgi:hypothetical protein